MKKGLVRPALIILALLGIGLMLSGGASSAPLRAPTCSSTRITDCGWRIDEFGRPVPNTLSAAVSGVDAASGAVLAINNTGTGGTETGLHASGENYGVFGSSASGYAMFGYSSGSGIGMYGQSSSGWGVGGFSTSGTGVNGQSPSGTGVDGQSSSGTGVHGQSSSSGYGVFGTSGTGTGVYGSSGTGYGMYALSGSLAFIAAGTGGTNIIEAWDYDGASNLRFEVERATGNVNADGAYSTPASDFAEMMVAPGSGFEPGDVLVISPDSPNSVALSTQPSATSLIGVYSTKPGFVGGFSDELDQSNMIPVAITGIVPVKVSAENGAILPGDLLTSSSLPGYAMKASPVSINGITFYLPGTILGKALEPLEEGAGTILVLITLQ